VSLNVPPWYMSKWSPHLRELTIYTVSVRLSEEEAKLLEKACRRLVIYNPCFMLSEQDIAEIDEDFINRAVIRLNLGKIIEKVSNVLNSDSIVRHCKWFTIRFEHASPKDIASQLYDTIRICDDVGIVSNGLTYAFHVSRIDVGLILALMSDRVLMMDRERSWLRFNHIHLRPFVNDFDVEWRLFYINNRLVGASQYYTNLSTRTSLGVPEPPDIEKMTKLAEEARRRIPGLDEMKNYTIDIAFIRAPVKVEKNMLEYSSPVIIDINPLYRPGEKENEETYLGLFTWQELEELYQKGRIEIRYMITLATRREEHFNLT